MRDIPKLKNLALPALIVASLFALQLYYASIAVPTWRYHGMVMGTSYSVQVVHERRVDDALIKDALDGVNKRMSTYIKDSELSALNLAPAAQPRMISTPLRQVLSAAKRITTQSGGAFDVTVGPLVNAWGFGPDGRKPTPSAETLKALRAQTGDALWTLDHAGVTKQRADVYFDLSAIAKGFAVDEVAHALESRGVTNYWVEVGGEVRTRGVNAEGRLWRVGIERPSYDEHRRVAQIISLKDMSVATSGDYRNRYRDDQGVIRSHTIDPRTGEPVRHTLASVSVLHQENMHADAWATALNVLGADEGLKLANQRQLMALFIMREQVKPDALNLDQRDTIYTMIESEALKRYLEALE